MRTLLALSLASFLLAGCREPEWQRISRSEDCILVVLTASSSDEERNELLDANLYREWSGEGKRFRPGVRAIVKRDVGGAPGYEVCFKDGASLDAKSQLAESLRKSTIVVDVFEGTSDEAAAASEGSAEML